MPSRIAALMSLRGNGLPPYRCPVDDDDDDEPQEYVSDLVLDVARS
jgi:hypothetical protein